MKRKLSEKELMKRKFRKFLYDNDVLDVYEKRVRELGFPDSDTLTKVYKRNPRWWINSFNWVPNEGIDFWSNLSVKWSKMC